MENGYVHVMGGECDKDQTDRQMHEDRQKVLYISHPSYYSIHTVREV